MSQSTQVGSSWYLVTAPYDSPSIFSILYNKSLATEGISVKEHRAFASPSSRRPLSSPLISL